MARQSLKVGKMPNFDYNQESSWGYGSIFVQGKGLQQNFNADELEEEKELFDNDFNSDNGDYDYEAYQDSLDDFLNVEMAVYSE